MSKKKPKPPTPFALYQAFDRLERDKVEEMLAKGADVNGKDKFGNTTLHMACSPHVADFIPELLKRGADPNAVSTTIGTPLCWLTARYFSSDKMSRAVAAAKALVKYGANVDLPDPEGVTPLMHTAKDSNTRLAKILIDNGADLNARDKRGLTALMRSQSGRFLKLLLQRGADPTIRNAAGQTAWEYMLTLERTRGYKQMAKQLQEHVVKVPPKPPKKRKK